MQVLTVENDDRGLVPLVHYKQVNDVDQNSSVWDVPLIIPTK